MWLRGLYRNEPIFEPEDFKEAAVCAGMSENEIENTLKIHTEPEVKHRLRQTTDEADALNAVGCTNHSGAGIRRQKARHLGVGPYGHRGGS